MAKSKAPSKRVYEVRATSAGRSCVLAISGDAVLLDLHLALLGAFDWNGDYGTEERGAYRVDLPDRGKRGESYTEGRGSRTALRRLLASGSRFTCSASDPPIEVRGDVTREYDVPNRRHYPKVLDVGGDELDAKVATWRAQGAARREFRDPVRQEPPSEEYVHGLFSAVVAGPPVIPSAWLPIVVRGADYGTLADMQRAVDPIMEAYNAVARGVNQSPDAFVAGTAALLASRGSAAVRAWVRGFVHGMALAGDEWQQAFAEPEFRRSFEPIATVMQLDSSAAKRAWLDDAGLREKLGRACPMAAIAIASFWRSRGAGVMPVGAAPRRGRAPRR